MAEMKLELILFWLQVSAFIDLQLCPLERERERVRENSKD